MSRKSRQRKRRVIGSVSIRVMAEYDSSGLWLMEQTGVFRHKGIGYAALHLPPTLATQFQQWIAWYWDCLEADQVWERPDASPFDYESFNQTGRELAKALKAHLGPGSYVEFVPENANGGLRAPEVIA